MPAPPEIEVTINEAAYTRVCGELGIPTVPVRLRPAKDGRTLGVAHGSSSITIFYGHAHQVAGRLLWLTNEICRTLLHELRHIHQDATWPPEKWREDERYSYSLKPSEIDADDYAERNQRLNRDLVRVKRVGASSLGRLASAERNIRRAV